MSLPAVRNTLHRGERLRKETDIRLLFTKGHSFLVHPILVHYMVVEPSDRIWVKALFAVPKKKLRKAVRRNYVKRVFRENFRTGKHALAAMMETHNHTLHISFSYIGHDRPEFGTIQQTFSRIWERMLQNLEQNR